MQKNNEKQTAIKLLNKYAEEYHVLEEQITLLRRENEDLKSNLQINKEIIQGFFQKTSVEDKVNLFISKLKEENKLITSRLKSKEKELASIKGKTCCFEQIVNTQMNSFKEDLEKTKNKCFILENLIIEKNNIIQNLSKKTKRGFTTESGEKYHEVYITNPNDVVNKLNDKLELYKEINNKLSKHIKSLKSSMLKNEKLMITYEMTNAKYKQELNAIKQQKNNSNILAQIGQPSMNRPNTSKSQNTSGNHSITNTYKLNKSSNISTYDHMSSDNRASRSRRTIIKEIEKLEGVNKNKISIHQFDLTEEWYETLKHCSLSQEEYIKFCKNKLMNKLTDVIEYLYKLIIDKNIQIKLLTEENDCLNADNINLNKINIELIDDIEMLKCTKDSGDNSTSNYSHRKKGADTSTFVNVEEKNRDYCYTNYMSQIRESISSSEFREAMILDKFDLVSEMSKKVEFIESNANEVDKIKILTDI